MKNFKIKLNEFVNLNKQSQSMILEIKKMEEQLEVLNEKMKNEFIPYVRDVYNNWRPKIGEIVISVNLSSDNAYEQVVSEINGSLIRVKNCPSGYCRVDLDIKEDDYDSLHFVLPLEAYNEIKTIYKIDYCCKLRTSKEEILAEKHCFPL